MTIRYSAFLVPLLLGACWTPGPGQVDPTRYPWDQRIAHGVAAGDYCVVQLETPSPTGIGSGRIVARGQVPTFEQVPPGAGAVTELTCGGETSRRD
ncbi:hypothetical protein H9L13_07520 [Sphingomonas lutea]|uniref:Uncharacterized protein n=1 Tax=Sphingomonas lutea TaxID=1045317 RepID=A0A7G9SFD6_9SPHN|nr:hypothetical protein [Sphingomonas lutea]QNN66561.1 hypothetical protein H9L13_07520 [Sphingomonas lutea]